MSNNKTPDYWMQQALEQAKLAQAQGEVPVGAVLVLDNKLIASGFNKSITAHDCTLHAEIDVIRQAGNTLKNYRLINCELYVTLEPCMMCLGAMIHSRISKLFYAASDSKTGAVGGLTDLQQHYKANHSIQVHPNILAAPCSEILINFFRAKRG